MDLNQTFSALENEKDCLFISDLSEEVDLPMITRTFSYGEKFNEVDEDGTIISKNNLQTAGSPRFDKTQDSTKTDEIIPSSPVFSSSSRRGLRSREFTVTPTTNIRNCTMILHCWSSGGGFPSTMTR